MYEKMALVKKNNPSIITEQEAVEALKMNCSKSELESYRVTERIMDSRKAHRNIADMDIAFINLTSDTCMSEPERSPRLPERSPG